MASFYFYLSWEPAYVLILLFVILITYSTTLGINRANDKDQKLLFLYFSVIGNLGLLFFFKFFNFFNESFRGLFSWFDLGYRIPYLEILLPVGVSFFTLQAVSYSVDVYRDRIPPERHLGNFALYLAFFPKLIAGPIERGANLLPQFWRKHHLDLVRISSGAQLMGWGFFKKLVIADRLSIYVDMVFRHPQDYSGKTLILAAYFFSLQIYCDFSGYTDIARGCGRIFGFELMENFNFPYFARSIQDFWRRWHISLTTWFRDYLYVPLGGNQVKPVRWRVNILTVFLLSGLWHGANWTFLCWGAMHGLFYLFGRTTAGVRLQLRKLVGLGEPFLGVWQVLVTFNLVAFAWVFFRVESVGDAIYIFTHFFVNLSAPLRLGPSHFTTAVTACLAVLFIVLELLRYLVEFKHIRVPTPVPFAFKCPAYSLALITIFLFGVSGNEFIYFHF